MPSREQFGAQRGLWSAVLAVAAYAMLPHSAAAAGPPDPITTPVASILASLPVRTPTPLPAVKLPVDTPDPTVKLPTLPPPTAVPTVRLTPVPTLPTLPIPLPTTTLPLPTPTIPLPTPSLPIATPTPPLPGITPSPGPTLSATPSASAAGSPGLGIGGIGEPGNPFTPEGGVSSITGPHNGVIGTLRDLGIPALILGLPALALLLVLGAQGAVAAAWLPVVRRFMGGFGPVRKR